MRQGGPFEIGLPARAAELRALSQHRLVTEARKVVLTRTLAGIAAYPILVGVIGGLADDPSRHPTRFWAFGVALSIVVVVRLACYRHAVRDFTRWTAAARTHIALGIASTAAFSVYTAWLLHEIGNTPATMAALVTVTGVCAVTVGIAAPQRSMALAWGGAGLVPVVLGLIGLWNELGFGMGTMFTLYALIMGVTVRRAHDAYWDAQISAAMLDERAHESVVLSRFAGMAEVATNVLHDVGNTLNGVKASLSVLRDGASDAVVRGCRDLATTLGEQADLAAFFGHDPRAPHVLPFLHALAAEADDAHASTIGELDRLEALVQHVETVVRRQQDIAGIGRHLQACSVADLVDRAVSAVGVSSEAWGLELDIPVELTVHADPNRTLQVLVNLLKNAVEATADCAAPRIVVTASGHGGHARLVVTDNGVGLPPGRRDVFPRGQSTKAHGHGFGLHHSAALAKAMGGRLWLDSDGPGRGVRAVLELPNAELIDEASRRTRTAAPAH